MVRPLVFLTEVRSELTKVIWPTKSQIFRLTLIVVLVSILVGVFIGALDYIFAKVMEVAFKK